MSNEQIIGSGIIGLPNAIAQSGFYLGFAMLVFCGIITNYSLRMLINAGTRAHVDDFEELMKFCFGRRG